jgi:ABC-type multidrug transport system ATPase subunit
MTISVSNLGKRFNREWIFQGLSAEFLPGNIYAITGPNGSGKSTLMQVLWGQIPASQGKLEFHDKEAQIAVEDAYQHISIATPYMDLLEEFTLQEQIDFHFRFKQPTHGLSTDQIINKLEMGVAANKPIKQFSSGMKQRVKLGLGLFSTCQALFLDEPTTNLDKSAAAWYMQNLLANSSEKVVFIATNQTSDYPASATILDLSTLKRVTNPIKLSIQPS